MDMTTAVLPQATGVGELDLLVLLAQSGLHPQTGILVALAVAGYLLLVRRIDRALGPIRTAVVEIQTILSTAGMHVQFLLTEAPMSPIQPSLVGDRLLRESGFRRLIDQKKDILCERLDREIRHGPDTPYDVQEKALAVLRAQRDRRRMDPIKSYAYREGLDLDGLLRLGALVLRDLYLAADRRRR